MIELQDGKFLRYLPYVRCADCRVRYSGPGAHALGLAHVRRTEHHMAYGNALAISQNLDGKLAAGEAPFFVKVDEILAPIVQAVLPFS